MNADNTSNKLVIMSNEFLASNHTPCEMSNGEVGVNGHAESEVDAEDTPTIDIMINNVVCTFSTKCHLNLKKVAMEGSHVEYRREHGVRFLNL